MTLQLSKTTILSIAALVFVAALVYAAQTSAAARSFGFEKNADHRKSADSESVAGCVLSCEDMLAGLHEMNPDSKNYTRQQDKIAAKAEQCLAMNELADFPYNEEEILASCGLAAPRCVEIPPDGSVHSGACKNISFIEEANLPQCCSLEGGIHGVDCGADAEWVVGVAAFPVCYVPNS